MQDIDIHREIAKENKLCFLNGDSIKAIESGKYLNLCIYYTDSPR